MSSFKGYVLRATATNKIFPNKYLQWAKWKSTPNQREEIKAWRDENTRDLFRITAQGTKSKIEFSTRPNLNLEQTDEILNFFTDAESSLHERKINLQYWNDESRQYFIGDFYRPDISFTIKRIDEATNDIIYDAVDIKLVEY